MEFTCETATLADAVQKAARVAPVKGVAHDKAAGIVFELAADTLTIKATDLESTFLQTIKPTDPQGDGVWRLPSQVVSDLISRLPLGSGQTVKLSEVEQGIVSIVGGRTKSKLKTFLGDSFPKFFPFDPDGMAKVDNLAQRLQQVAWASERGGEAPFGGVHIDGTRLVSSDRTKVAEVPCVIPVDEPITVPLFSLAGVMKNTATVSMRVENKRLHLMTDDDTQLTANIFDADWPSQTLDMVRERTAQHPHRFTVSPAAVTDALNRMLVLCKSERYPLVELTFSNDALHVAMDVPEVGEMEEVVDCAGTVPGDVTVLMTPHNVIGALGAVKDAAATVRFADDPKAFLRIEDSSGYLCVMAPRVRSRA